MQRVDAVGPHLYEITFLHGFRLRLGPRYALNNRSAA